MQSTIVFYTHEQSSVGINEVTEMDLILLSFIDVPSCSLSSGVEPHLILVEPKVTAGVVVLVVAIVSE